MPNIPRGPVPLPPDPEALIERFPTPSPPWPPEAALPPSAHHLRDAARGSLAWGAIGDALGRPTEGRSREAIVARWGPTGVTGLVPWHGWTSGPIGTWTDDTQLTVEVAESLVALHGRIDPEDLARRLVAWRPRARGIGRATATACGLLSAGTPWWQVGTEVDSAGNGAAMRVAPIGIVHALDPEPAACIRAAVLSALPTHTHPVGVAAAVAMAVAVAWVMRAAPAGMPLDPDRCLAFVTDAIADIEPGPSRLRSAPDRAVTLRDRLAGLGDVLADDPDDVYARLWTGAFALESVPAAFFAFLRAPDDPVGVVLGAASCSHDTDTIASMAGNLAGARAGAERLRTERPEWWTELEERERILSLADALVARTDDGTRTGAR